MQVLFFFTSFRGQTSKKCAIATNEELSMKIQQKKNLQVQQGRASPACSWFDLTEVIYHNTDT